MQAFKGKNGHIIYHNGKDMVSRIHIYIILTRKVFILAFERDIILSYALYAKQNHFDGHLSHYHL